MTDTPTPNHIENMASGRTPAEIADDAATLRRAAFLLSLAVWGHADYLAADLNRIGADLDALARKRMEARL